jgi:hypothetical protein
MAANDYITVAEIKEAVPDTGLSGVNTYDAFLAKLATRASRCIDTFAGRKPGAFYVSTDVIQYFDGSAHVELWVGELAAAPTTVEVLEDGINYTAWAATDYMLWPYNAADEGIPYLRLDIDLFNGTKAQWYRFPRSVKITGKFGYSTTVPDDIKQMAVIQAVRWFKRGQQGFRDVSANAELGQLMYAQKLDPDLAALLPHYERVAI